MIIKSAEWTPEDWATFSRYILGGAAAGTGLAAVTGLMNHMKLLRHQATAEERLKKTDIPILVPDGADDDQKVKSASNVFFTPTSVGIPAAMLSGMAFYTQIQEMMRKLRKAEIEKQLEDANEGYITALEQQKAMQTKSANGPGFFEPGAAPTNLGLLSAILISGIPLTAYLSYAAANKVLDKAFPKPPKSEEALPPRFAIQHVSSERPKAGDDESMVKQGTARWLALTCMGLPDVVENSIIPGFISAACQDDLFEDMVKSASLRDLEVLIVTAEQARSGYAMLSPGVRVTGVERLVKNASIRPLFETLAAAEVYEAFPHFAHACSDMREHPEVANTLVKTAADMSRVGAAVLCGHDPAVTASEERLKSVLNVINPTIN